MRAQRRLAVLILLAVFGAGRLAGEAKPAESKPVESKPAESNTAESKPAESNTAESNTAESKPASKRATEEAMYESGMVFTVLQPTMFMQTMANGWKEAETRGGYSLPYSKQKKASYVDYRDVAESAALALTSERLD